VTYKPRYDTDRVLDDRGNDKNRPGKETSRG